MHIQNSQQLYHALLKKSIKPVSDRTIVENGTIKVVTTAGASLTSDRVLNAPRDLDQLQIAQRQQCVIVQLQRKEQAVQRILPQTNSQERRADVQRKKDDRKEAEKQKLCLRRESHRQRLDETREFGRRKAKHSPIQRL